MHSSLVLTVPSIAKSVAKLKVVVNLRMILSEL